MLWMDERGLISTNPTAPSSMVLHIFSISYLIFFLKCGSVGFIDAKIGRYVQPHVIINCAANVTHRHRGDRRDTTI